VNERVLKILLYAAVKFPLTTLIFLSKDTNNISESAVQINGY